MSNFKIYCIIGKSIKIVDSCYKLKVVNSNLFAYIIVDESGRKGNEIKMLSVGHSDYRLTKAYEEIDGKIIEFLIQEG